MFSLRFINEALCHKDIYGGGGGIAPPFLTSSLGGDECSASRTDRFIHRETTPGTHSIGGWVGPRAGLVAVYKRNILVLPAVEPLPSMP
jgi:hypothetical protein